MANILDSLHAPILDSTGEPIWDSGGPTVAPDDVTYVIELPNTLGASIFPDENQPEVISPRQGAVHRLGQKKSGVGA